MKVIEGFHIKKIQRGTKKGQDYINHNKRYAVSYTHLDVYKRQDYELAKEEMLKFNNNFNEPLRGHIIELSLIHI